MLNTLKILMDQLREPVIAEQDGEIVFMNKAAAGLSQHSLPEELFGYTPPYCGSVTVDGIRYRLEVTEADNLRLYFLHSSEPENEELMSAIGVSLKNILLTIQMAANMLDNDSRNDNLKYYQAVLRHQSFYINKIANDILFVSGGDSIDKLFHVDLVSLYSDIVNTVNILTNGRKAHILFKSKLDTLEMIGNGHALERLLLNILSYSLKSSEADKEIVVSVAKKDENAVISVLDSSSYTAGELRTASTFGSSLEENLSKIGSVGIGRAVVQGIIEKMNGTLLITDSNNGGSVVTVSLPLEQKERSGLMAEFPIYDELDMSVIHTELCEVLSTDCYSDIFSD